MQIRTGKVEDMAGGFGRRILLELCVVGEESGPAPPGCARLSVWCAAGELSWGAGSVAIPRIRR